MRTYVGERACRYRFVCVVEDPDGPALAEVGRFFADLRPFIEHNEETPPSDVAEWARLAAWERDLERRRETLFGRSDVNWLPHVPEDERSASFEWGDDPARTPELAQEMLEWGDHAAGALELARAILTYELGHTPPEVFCERFRDDVVVGFRWARFRLESTEIEQWVAHDAELHRLGFNIDPPRSNPAVGHVDGAGRAVPADTAPQVDDPAAASEVVRACEEAWAAIRAHHPDLPDAVIVLGSGVERGRLVKLGHWATGRWVADGHARGEVLVAGEALHQSPSQVFEILLHEAAHALCAARRIPDTSRDGRYHNARFAAVAAEVGLTASPTPPHGLARTTLTPAAEALYAQPIGRLGDAMRIARRVEASGLGPGRGADSSRDDGERTRGRTGSRSSTSAECGCGRKLRIAPATLAAGAIFCGLCSAPFVAVRRVERASDPQPRAVPDKSGPRPGPSLDLQLAATVERLRARLDAALRDPSVDAAHAEHFAPLRDRAARLGALAQRLGAEGATAADLTVDQLTGVAVVRNAHPADLATLRDWYRGFGTAAEEPLRATNDADAARLTRVARALLRADGTVRGPDIATAGGTFAAGDRVIVTADDPARGVPQGTLGTVRNVDPDGHQLQIDFATLARLDVAVGEALAARLRHDYVEVAPEPSPDLSEAALEAEVQRTLLEIEP